MLVAAAFAPHPPVIVPELAAGAAGELDDLRAACDHAVERVLAAAPGVVVVLGAGPAAARWSSGDSGSLAGYGRPVSIALADRIRPGRPGMPLSVTVGAWLLRRAGYAGHRLAVTVPPETTDPEVDRWAADLAGLDRRLALLVMGGGSARRSERAPGHLDPRAAMFDAGIAAALAGADVAALRRADPVLGAELLAAGVPAWRLAAAIASVAGGPLRGELSYRADPYGVDYVVATWLSPAGGPPVAGTPGVVSPPVAGRPGVVSPPVAGTPGVAVPPVVRPSGPAAPSGSAQLDPAAP